MCEFVKQLKSGGRGGDGGGGDAGRHITKFAFEEKSKMEICMRQTD